MKSFLVRQAPLGILLMISSNNLLADADKQIASTDFYNLSLAELGQIDIAIATGNSTPLDKAPGTATVVYAAEIEAMGARTLNDVLEAVPGVHVSLSSLSRLDSVYSIRGIHTGFDPQVLLLLNGVPVQASLQSSRPTLLRLPVTSIERVEVIRGPGSAIYGADAYAGVINVITKNSTSLDGIDGGVRSGSFNSHDVWLQGGTQWHGLGIAFDIAYQESDGDNSRVIHADLQSTLDKIFGTHASLAPGPLSTRYQIVDSHLSLTGEQMQANFWHWLSSNAGLGAGGAQALDQTGRDDNHLFLSDLTYHLNKDTQHWDNSIHLSYFYYDIQSFFNLLPAGSLLPIGSDGNLNFTAPAGLVQFPDGFVGNPGGVMRDGQIDIVSVFNGINAHRLRFAAGGRRQTAAPYESKNFGPGVIDGTVPVIDGTPIDVSGTPYVFLDDRLRISRYLSVQDEWQLSSNIELTTGLRYDKYSDFGSTTNPRIALVWATSEKLTTKLLYGSAFRAPSFSELGFKNNPVSLGNPDLKPEQIDTDELSFNYRINDNFQSTLTLFHYNAKDMIEFIADEYATTKTAQNARDQDGKGLEWEINWNPTTQLHLSSSYSWQDATDRRTNAAIPDAPQQLFKINANWSFAHDWNLNSQLDWVGERKRAQDDPRPAIDNYTWVNVTLRRTNLLKDLDVSFAVRNATNADAREPSTGTIAEDYPLESRSVWVSCQYHFH